MTATMHWTELLRYPAVGDHMVHLYQDSAFLAEAVSEYVHAGLRAGEAAIVVATAEHRRLLQEKGLVAGPALRMLDAEEVLGRFMAEGQPQWTRFHQAIGGLIAELRLQYPAVRVYGEMVDLLWRRGEHDAAERLEGYWNELGRLQSFSLLCAYYMDTLDAGAYRGPLECVCRTHTHLIPARDYERFDEAVHEASREVLEQPLARMLQSLSSVHRPATAMPSGQATLLWLAQNMPRTAARVLEKARGNYLAS